VQHQKDLVVTALSDGHEVREAAVLGEAQRAVEPQGTAVVAAGVQGEDLDTGRARVLDQRRGQCPSDPASVDGTGDGELLQIGVRPVVGRAYRSQ
jgi:hypothetical protein